MKARNLEQSYQALLEFLLLSKRQLHTLGLEHGLTGIQAMTIFLLDSPRPMHSFKTTYNCDASNVTGIIDGLEQKKLAERCESPKDRRIKMVQLTAKGTQVRIDLLKAMMGPDSLLRSKLTEPEIDQFIALVQKITS